MTLNLDSRQNKLLEFVKDQHGDQVRKYTNEPYWKHVFSVAQIFITHGFGDHHSMGIEIALCHDLFEDTKCNDQELYNFLIEVRYSPEQAAAITEGVIYLTDHFTKAKYPQLNRGARKASEAKRLGLIPELCQSVKYADLIDNTSSIVNYDPGFADVYLKEKRKIIQHMRGGNINLLIECCHTLRVSEEKLLTLSENIDSSKN